MERFNATPASASGDPLLNRGLEKLSAVLTVTGPFEQVLAFLQSLNAWKCLW